MTSKPETPAETQYRLASEKECRRIADLIKGELSPRLGFVLITADIGDAKSFSNTSYVASINREDSGRLLTELLDNWRSRGLNTEPSIRTCTALREGVFGIRDNPPEKLLHGARCSLRDGEAALRMRDTRRAAIQLLKLATEALALFGKLVQTTPPEGD